MRKDTDHMPEAFQTLVLKDMRNVWQDT